MMFVVETLFKIGNLTIYTHGLFIVLAILVAAFFLYKMSSRFSKKSYLIYDLISYSVILGIIAARLLYVILYHAQFSNWSDAFKFWQGGLVSWGGYIAAALCAFFLVKAQKENVAKWMDAILLSGLLAIGVGRIGCFVSGELAGKISNGPLSFHGKYPTTLFEAIYCLAVFGVLLRLYYANKNQDGFWWKISLLSYAFGRFLIDFSRQETVLFMHLSLSQVFGLIISMALLVWIFYERNIYLRSSNA